LKKQSEIKPEWGKSISLPVVAGNLKNKIIWNRNWRNFKERYVRMWENKSICSKAVQPTRKRQLREHF